MYYNNRDYVIKFNYYVFTNNYYIYYIYYIIGKNKFDYNIDNKIELTILQL
jgi:hypothetical protein